jgi:hypothetical protein
MTPPASAANHLDRPGGVREQPRDRPAVEVDDLDRAELDPTVAAVPHQLAGRAGPRQPNQVWRSAGWLRFTVNR